MKPVDDLILEYLGDEDSGTPETIAEAIDRHPKYVGNRCRELLDRGLLDRPSRGYYLINEAGREYLAGDLDASELKDETAD